jgi:hypothetical protein
MVKKVIKTVRQLRGRLLRDHYTILSAERTERSAAENERLTTFLKEFVIKGMGLEFYEVDGVYDNPNVTEKSFLVFFKDIEDMGRLESFAEHVADQESILVHYPLISDKHLVLPYATLVYLNGEKQGKREELEGLRVESFKFQDTYISRIRGENLYFAFGVGLSQTRGIKSRRS